MPQHVKKEQMVSQGCDPVSVFNALVAMGYSTTEAQKVKDRIFVQRGNN